MNEQMTSRIVLFKELQNAYGMPPEVIGFGGSRDERARITLVGIQESQPINERDTAYIKLFTLPSPPHPLEVRAEAFVTAFRHLSHPPTLFPLMPR